MSMSMSMSMICEEWKGDVHGMNIIDSNSRGIANNPIIDTVQQFWLHTEWNAVYILQIGRKENIFHNLQYLDMMNTQELLHIIISFIRVRANGIQYDLLPP